MPAPEGDQRFFRCPHCGEEIDRLQLATFWNEWGIVCRCPQCEGEVDCPAFPVHAERGR